jgi:hypothetical protein
MTSSSSPTTARRKTIPRDIKIKVIKELDDIIQNMSQSEMRADLELARDAMIKELEKQELQQQQQQGHDHHHPDL